jgi:copper chaperone NosL
MEMSVRRTILGGFIVWFIMTGFAIAWDKEPVKPSPKDKCPVCGMFVAKYPDWVGKIIYKDGMTVFFDGAKDLFRYSFDIKKYHPGKDKASIAAIYVTEYYDLKPIDAYKAYYVVGGDIYGPMGRELIPFKNEADAREFMIDHKGKKVIRFKDVTTGVIASLD